MSLVYSLPGTHHIVLDSRSAFAQGTTPYTPKQEYFNLSSPYDTTSTTLEQDTNHLKRRRKKRKRKDDSSYTEAQLSYRDHQNKLFEEQRDLRNTIRAVLDQILTGTNVFNVSHSVGDEKTTPENSRKEYGIDFVAFAELAKMVRQGFQNTKNGNLKDELSSSFWDQRIDISDSVADHFLELSDVYETLIRNDSDHLKKIVFNLQDGANRNLEYLIPPKSSFVMSNMTEMQCLVAEARRIDGFDFIVLDPPWSNSSAARSDTYATQSNDHSFYRLPLPSLLSSDALVAVWITNRSRLSRFVTTKLFPAWDLEVMGIWYWIKVTRKGETVLNLEDKRRRTWEPIIIGRRRKKSTEQRGEEVAVGTDEENPTQPMMSVPENRFLFSTPSTVHSRKPPLFDSFKPYLPTDRPPKCLELFSRCLTPGWTSWGNEPLKFQSVEYFESMEQGVLEPKVSSSPTEK